MPQTPWVAAAPTHARTSLAGQVMHTCVPKGRGDASGCVKPASANRTPWPTPCCELATLRHLRAYRAAAQPQAWLPPATASCSAQHAAGQLSAPRACSRGAGRCPCPAPPQGCWSPRARPASPSCPRGSRSPGSGGERVRAAYVAAGSAVEAGPGGAGPAGPLGWAATRCDRGQIGQLHHPACAHAMQFGANCASTGVLQAPRTTCTTARARRASPRAIWHAPPSRQLLPCGSDRSIPHLVSAHNDGASPLGSPSGGRSPDRGGDAAQRQRHCVDKPIRGQARGLEGSCESRGRGACRHRAQRLRCRRVLCFWQCADSVERPSFGRCIRDTDGHQ